MTELAASAWSDKTKSEPVVSLTLDAITAIGPIWPVDFPPNSPNAARD